MVNNTQHKKIQYLSTLILNHKEFRIDGFDLIIHVDSSLHQDIKTTLSNLDISFTESIQSELIISLRKKSIGFKVFFDKPHFLKDFNLSHLEDDFAILHYDETYMYYSKIEDLYIKEAKDSKTDLLIDNTIAYLGFKKVLSQICDYHNSANSEYVFYTSTKGIYKLSYPNITPDFSHTINDDIEKLNRNLHSADFKLFFINELFDYLKNSTNPIFDLIKSIESITSSAERNHQLYLKNFSFEEFHTKLQKEKSQYFESIREILGKSLSQLISIPISLSAMIFAIYKIDNIYAILVICFGYFLYLTFFIKFQFIYFSDILEIESDFKIDFKKIAQDSGLPINDITIEEKKIKRRIKNLKFVIIFLIITKIILSLLLYTYVIEKAKIFSITGFIKECISIIQNFI